MKGTLVIQVLNIQSSFLQERSEPAETVFDTIQFWVTDNTAWRIRTYALDHDIHIYQLGYNEIPGNPVEWLSKDSKVHFEEEIDSEYIFSFKNVENKEEVEKVFESTDLTPDVEFAENGFCFWKPDDGNYHTQSTPEWV